MARGPDRRRTIVVSGAVLLDVADKRDLPPVYAAWGLLGFLGLLLGLLHMMATPLGELIDSETDDDDTDDAPTED